MEYIYEYNKYIMNIIEIFIIEVYNKFDNIEIQ